VPWRSQTRSLAIPFVCESTKRRFVNEWSSQRVDSALYAILLIIRESYAGVWPLIGIFLSRAQTPTVDLTVNLLIMKTRFCTILMCTKQRCAPILRSAQNRTIAILHIVRKSYDQNILQRDQAVGVGAVVPLPDHPLRLAHPPVPIPHRLWVCFPNSHHLRTRLRQTDSCNIRSAVVWGIWEV
jgi:hypothetical protein